MADFHQPTIVWCPRSGGGASFFLKLTAQNYRDGTTVWWKFRNPILNRFCMIHPCDKQTDGR